MRDHQGGQRRGRRDERNERRVLISRTAQILSVHGAQVDRLRRHDALRLDERDESGHSGHSVVLRAPHKSKRQQHRRERPTGNDIV